MARTLARFFLTGTVRPPSAVGTGRPMAGTSSFHPRATAGMTSGRFDAKGAPLRKAEREPVQLTTGPLYYWAPLPSRDGKRLYVVGEQPRGELVRYDAKSRQNVPYLSGLSVEHVRFSRDGAWAAYVAFPEGTLWRSKLDGSERLQLTFPPMLA